MCGIVGYTGSKKCRDILMGGLKRLEYRGYDSSGIAVMNGNMGNDGAGSKCKIMVAKEAGKINILEDKIENFKMDGDCGIGHTRWATHGEPTKVNAHPHLEGSGRIAVVHNGIIENYVELREELEKKGHSFISDTDTEVLPHLLEEYKDGSLIQAMRKVLKKVKGSGAIVAISSDRPGELVGARIFSPLIVGISPEGNFIASDIPAVLE